MSLNSFSFIIIFIGLLFILAVLQLIKNRHIGGQIQLVILLVFSYFILYESDWRFCICTMSVTVITYVCGRVIENAVNKRPVVIIGTACLIGFLAYFKYTNFFIENICNIVGKSSITIDIILPIGISFYVFSSLSYIIDIYRGSYEAEKNILYLSLYIAFFPKLTAGPIVRGSDFFPQVRNYRGVEWDSLKNGIQIFAFGLFKKMVMADHLGVFVDNVFFAPKAYNTGTIILAAISYSLQIYFDFSGYSDMAIGISKIVGFDFKPNFNLPYIAENESDFWNRWHISLSSWFRDYVYIPLGGSRKSNIRTYFNLIFTMILSGLWHGAGWTFIIWGFSHGVFSCIHRFAKIHKFKGVQIINITITFILVTLLWVVFRATSFSNALAVVTGMFTIHSGISQPYTWSFFAIIVLVISTIIAKINCREKERVEGFYPLLDLSKFWAQIVFFTFCGLIIIMGYHGNTAFIYGKF